MDLKTLLTADYLDIIFDQRNKQYGGYELRRSYNRRIKKAAGFAILGISACLTFSFVSANRGTIELVAKPKVFAPSDVFPPPPKVPPVPKTPATPPPAAPKVHTILSTPPVIAETVPEDKVMPEAKDLKTAQPGDANVDGPDVSIVPTGTGHGPGTGTGITEKTAPTGPVTWVQQMPQFVGSLPEYLGKNLQYPPAAKESGLIGTVVIQFVVNEDGSISNAKVVRSIGGGCDEEALRIISAMPKWKPGKQNGIAVKVLFSQSIKFVLQ